MAFLVLNRMEGEFHVVRVESSEVPVYTHVRLSYNNNLDIKFIIKPINVMQGEYEVLERPRIVDTLYPVRDTYVYEAVPTLNYGSRTAFHVGKDQQGNRLRSLVAFDLNTLKDNLYITHAQLVLTVTNVLYDLQHFEISSLNKKFHEYGATWSNQPTRDQFIDIVQIEPLQKHIKINVTKTVKNWYEKKRENNGFVLKEYENLAGELISFYSKEYGTDVSPKLEIEYLDPDFGVPKRNTFPILTRIQHRQNKDLLIRTKVQPIYGDSELNVNLFVHNRQELVIGGYISKQQTPIKFYVTKYLKEHLPIQARVQQTQTTECDIKLNISKQSIPIQYEVIPHRELLIEFIINREKFPIKTIINKEVIPINLHIKDHNDLPINFKVTKNSLSILVDTKKESQLSIITRVLGQRQSELPIIIGLNRPEITIQTDTKLSSSLGIKIETIGTIEIPIKARVQYSNFKSLDIQTDIIGNSIFPIQTDIKSPYLDIKTHIQIPRSNYFPIKTEIIQHSDLNVKCIIHQKNDIPIFVDVERIWFSDLGITLTIDGKITKRAYVFIF